ncbi:MAG: hypothetical protein AN485_14620 [Anabaena sp. MDT14b]|nr:MAG: hypothetical protein AN485_14620 [Anabaena sp. MDT14b]
MLYQGFTTTVNLKSLERKDIHGFKKIAVLLNIKHQDGNYTKLSDGLLLLIKKGLVNSNY